MACHFEAVCDLALIVLLFLSIGVGWTLPRDNVNPNANVLQRFLTDMAKPMGSSMPFNAVF
jgi:hypothetical protein